MPTEKAHLIGSPVEPISIKSPTHITLTGQYVTVLPLNPKQHAAALWDQTRGKANNFLWRYLGEGPFPDYDIFYASLEQRAASKDPLFFTIVENEPERAVGQVAFLRIEPAHRSLEVGHVLFTPALQRRRGATEAMYLMARYVFEELNYRRYEWKCNALNEPSRRAALRFGFRFEGIFRQHMIVKGRNRDTAWFSMLDSEWPECKERFERWLEPANFDPSGQQRSPLSAFR